MSDPTTTHTPRIAAPATSPDGRVSRRGLVLVFIALMLSMLASSLNNTIISSATPTIVGELHGVEHISWVITAYILASTIMMPIYGNLSDLFGRKRLLIVAIVIFMAGSVLGALAWSIEWLIAARLVQGIGGGGLMILSQATIADVVPARERGQYMGIMGGVFAFSSVAGPLIGGWLTDGPGWRWAFWFNIPLGVLALVGTILFLHLPKRQRVRTRIDYGGMMLLAVATTAVVLVSVWGGTTYAWSSPVIIGLIAAALLGGIGFVLVERKASSPIIPLKMFRHRNFVLTTIASLAVGVAMFGALGYLPTYLQVATGLGAAIAGLLMVPMMGSMLVTGIVVGRIVSVTGRYKWAPMSGLAVVIVSLALLGTVRVETPVWLVCIYMGVLGLGIGVGMQILTLIVQNEFPNRVVGTATAANNYFRQVGATLGSAVVGAVFAARLTELITNSLPSTTALPTDGAASLTPAAVWALPDPLREIVITAFNDALMPVYLWLIPVVVIGLVATFFIREKPLSTTIEREIPTESLSTGQLSIVDARIEELDAAEELAHTESDRSERQRSEQGRDDGSTGSRSGSGEQSQRSRRSRRARAQA